MNFGRAGLTMCRSRAVQASGAIRVLEKESDNTYLTVAQVLALCIPAFVYCLTLRICLSCARLATTVLGD